MVSQVYIRPLLALLVLVVIIGGTTVLFRNSPEETVQVRADSHALPGNIDVALKKARFSEIQDGLVAWELVAERVSYDKSGDKAYLVDIHQEFKHSGRSGAVTVTADYGEYSSGSKTIRLNGRVHVVTEDGASFKTDSIVYNGEEAQFSTPDPVIFRQQRLQLTATGMDLGVKNQKASFHSAVDATIAVN